MAHSQAAPPKTITDGETVHGMVAEFSDVSSLLAACERVRDAGYTKADAFTPFPVHGIDKALGIKPSVLPWIALAAGGTGMAIALLMQISMNSDWIEGFSYPYIISGKPYLSLPAFIPVTFELTILFASFGTFFGMWALNGLPKFSNPLFTSPRFDRATDDTFFLYLDAKDERFDEEGARALLGDLGGQYVEPVREDDSSKQIPRFLLITIAVLIGFSIIPALLVARMRVTKSTSPRFHVFPDMDFSPSRKMQMTSTLFADGRAMRPNVPGTVSRGQLEWDLDFQTGIDMEKLTQIDAPRARRLVAMMQAEGETEEGEKPTADKPESGNPEADKPEADKPESEKPAADKREADKPKADQPKSEMKGESADQPAGDAEPAAEEKSKDDADKPSDGETAETEKANSEESAMKDADAEKTEEKSPSEDKPKGENKSSKEDQPADGDKPAAKEQSGEENPAAMNADESASEEGKADKAPSETPDGLNAPAGPEEDTTPWLTKNPLEINAELLERGQEQFNIYCSVCHGMNGRGNGLVNQRAQRILATTWTPPSNMHDPTLYEDEYPDGKLFSTITNGVRKMAGYGSQIRAKDRWAVVAYVRALQASQNATIDDVPKAKRSAIEKRQAQVKSELKKTAAEAEAAAQKSSSS